ncbi:MULTISPECIES: TadE/TadG family type IV pilus assembly protein [unclassified Roseitalea]|uniref:TadE/TadG family type IV pilus assembly protein n=1 Tax=unclassified Roseitalea TaxID=2639107 RepID=UPI00273FD39E|nr:MULTISPECIES: TadE/TadG family type IV pilus assembly protein [unclassified Roseitalea]
MTVEARGQGFISRLRAWRGDRRGATAIEFAILALPFFLLTFAVLETTISFTVEQVMSNTTDQLARQVRTGQLDPATVDEDAFRELICERMEVFVPQGCPGLSFDLQNYASFANVPRAIPFSAPGVIDTSDFGYDPGGTGTINNLRIIYEWPVITNIMKSRIAGLEGGRVLLYATTTWQNEPF